MRQTKILIADDHTIVREGLKLMLQTEEEQYKVDEARDGREALELLRRHSYDLILLDIQMPVMDGIAFLQEKQRLKNTIPVIVLTMSDERKTIQEALNLGIKSFVLKDSSGKEMLNIIHSTLYQKAYLPAEVSEILSKGENAEQKAEDTPSGGLTEREILILKSIVRGSASKEIAIDMGITERTVKAHLTSIYRKLGAGSRAEAVAIALTKKIVSFPKVQ